MTNVTECIKLYATDIEVSAEQFRAVMLDAAARDAVDAASGDDRLEPARAELIAGMIDDRLRAVLAIMESITEGLGVVNDLDTMRADQIAAIEHRIEGLARAIGSEVEHSRKAS